MKRTGSPVVHLELHTDDRRAAAAFYAAVCGWHLERVAAGDSGYLAYGLGRLSGGIVECPAPRSLWLPYVEVVDISEAVRRAHRHGAAVLLAPREGPAGWRGVVAPPAGGELAFWQPKR